ncbi:MAG: OmpA family protein [Bacteroidaceae bacterium]|nr:OmpA family protein [Bacteroidaceae bacterium]
MKKLILFTLTLIISCLSVSAQSIADQAAAKDREIAALKKQLAEREARLRLEQPGNLMPTVYFQQNSSIVTSPNDPPIEMIANYIKARPNAIVEIRGYASVDESNPRTLCKARVDAVANELMVKYGINPQQLRIIVYGATNIFYKTPSYNRLVTFHDKNMQK